MPVVRYVAKRSLIAGVSLNDTVTLDLQLRYVSGLVRSRSATRFDHRSLTRAKHSSWYYGGSAAYSCQTIPLAPTPAAAMTMFLDSTEDGQEFLFSPTNVSTDSPIAWLDVKRSGTDYDANPDPLLNTLTTFGFAVEVL